MASSCEHVHFEVVDSTNLKAQEIIDVVVSGNDFCWNEQVIPAHSQAFCVSASRQTNGKGKWQRAWESMEGNVMCSFVNEVKDGAALKFLTFAASLAVLHAIKKVCKGVESKVNVKWPNDVLINEKKASGILCKVHKNYSIVGIGINVRNYPQGTNFPSTSMANEFGMSDLSCDQVLKVLEQEVAFFFNNLYTYGFKFIRSEWLQYAFKLNERIHITNQSEQTHAGTFIDICERTGEIVIDPSAPWPICSSEIL